MLMASLHHRRSLLFAALLIIAAIIVVLVFVIPRFFSGTHRSHYHRHRTQQYSMDDFKLGRVRQHYPGNSAEHNQRCLVYRQQWHYRRSILSNG
jgi:hypothetical protein